MTPLPRRIARARFTALVALAALTASPALAQVGGGGGWLAALWSTFLTNVVPGLGIAGVAFVGIMFLGGRIGLALVVMVAIGIYIISHADMIARLIGGL